MSVEIHAALVGGVLAGLVVIGGIAVEQWVTRVLARRDRIESAVRLVSLKLGEVVLPFMTAASTPGRVTAGGGEFQAVLDALIDVETTGRRWFPGRREARVLAEDLIARIYAAQARHATGTALTKVEFDRLHDQAAALHRATFGTREPANKAVERYVRTGVAHPIPDAERTRFGWLTGLLRSLRRDRDGTGRKSGQR